MVHCPALLVTSKLCIFAKKNNFNIKTTKKLFMYSLCFVAVDVKICTRKRMWKTNKMTSVRSKSGKK